MKETKKSTWGSVAHTMPLSWRGCRGPEVRPSMERTVVRGRRPRHALAQAGTCTALGCILGPFPLELLDEFGRG